MLIDRETKQKILKTLMDPGQSEFVTVYGRRRVDKSFLIILPFAQ